MSLPSHWIRGQLIDLRRYSDGTFKAVLLGEEMNQEHPNWIELSNADTAQALVSWWYAPESVRMLEREG